jgi:hypothetical protein
MLGGVFIGSIYMQAARHLYIGSNKGWLGTFLWEITRAKWEASIYTLIHPGSCPYLLYCRKF